MTRLVASFLLAMSGIVSSAGAETCVSDTFDRPYPGATEVATRHVDVPSSRFPAIWQEGRIDGFYYRVWSHEDAVLQSDRTAPEWAILVTCKAGETQCRRMVEGTAPAGAVRVADELASCLTNPAFAGRLPEATEDFSAPNVEEATQDDTPEPDETDVPPDDPASCGLADLPEGPPGLTLQRLLVKAGADPGPLDGIAGRKTYRALAEVLGETLAPQLREAEAIEALDKALCDDPETSR